MRPLTRLNAAAAAALALSACSIAPSFSVRVESADGVTMEVPLTARPEIDGGDAIASVKQFRYIPLVKGTDRAMGYHIELRFKGTARPTSIVVADVSDDPILSIADDEAPKFAKDGSWDTNAGPYNPNDPHMNWLLTLDNGARIYRFTMMFADGTTDVFRLPILMPGSTKAIFRAELGLK
jgi:hypothetical protein